MKNKIILLLLLLILFSGQVYGINLEKWMVHRALYVNNKAIKHSDVLNDNDKMTYIQAVNRVEWLRKYSYELNYLYPNIHPRRIEKDLAAIIETETRWVKYNNLDHGKSYGIMSMQISTGKEIANKLKVDFNKYSAEQQIKFGVYYYYYLLDYYGGDRYSAILGYNVGLGLDKNSKRYRNYLFLTIGRLQYYEKLWRDDVGE